MDYAKLALLKAEELEKKGQNSSPRLSRKGLIIQKALNAGESFTVCKLKAKGEAALMLSLDFAAGSGGAGQAFSGKVSLVLEGKTVFSRPAAASMMFTAGVVIEGETVVKIKTDGAVTLISADVLAIGAEASGPAGADVKTDFLEGYLAAVYENEGQIRLCAGLTPPNLADYVIAGFGQKPALASILENGQVCFGVLFIESGELIFSLFDKDRCQISCNYTGIKADSAALLRYGGGLAAGYIYKGIAYVVLLSRPDFDFGQSFKLERAAGIEFVKNALPPTVILNKNGKNVIRTAQPEAVYDDAVRVIFECLPG